MFTKLWKIIHPRKHTPRAEVPLLALVSNLETILEHIPGATAIFDRQMNYLWASNRWIRDFGLENTKLIGRSHYQVFPEIPPHWKEVHKRCLAGETLSHDGEAFVREDGTKYWIRWAVHPWKRQDGSIGGIVIFSEDISERAMFIEQLQEAKAAAESASVAKSAFLTNMSHEIRTPLSMVVGYSEMLEESEVGQEDRRKFANIIRRNAHHLMQIVNDLLDLARAESGTLKLSVQTVQLSRVFQEILDLFQSEVCKKGVTLNFSIEDSKLDTVSTDPLRLKQILINVVGNAIKFTEKGFVRVSAQGLSESGGELVQVLVTDSGPGILANARDKLFVSYSQGDDAVSRRHGGTGLGLAISRRLAQLLGGDVTLLESREGVGSTFSITFDPHLTRSTSTRTEEALVSARTSF
ncbi:MAG: PAS domain-containing sensor histidine kinase [Bdellovibrionales bacterium]